MGRWWTQLWAGVGARRRVDGEALPSAGIGSASSDAAPGESADPGGALLAWLLHTGTPRAAALDVAERQGIARLDALIGAAHTPADLLPRAPAVIPQLLSQLRQHDASLPAMSQRVTKDLVLTAEVLRQAGSAAYRAQGAVADVEQALALLGVDGLRTVIARVVLRPLFAGHTGRLALTSAARLWAYAEREAQFAAAAAAEQGLDRFDGYLGGLVHCTGWTVAFRALDRLHVPLALPFSAAFVPLLIQRKDALFGKVVGDWQLTPGLTALCAELRERGLAQAQSPLAGVLVHAQECAEMELVPRVA
jgi:hypothetical protein